MIFHLLTGYQARVIERLRSDGVDVTVSRRNAACYSDAKQLIYDCMELGPLGGLFNLAMVRLRSSSVQLLLLMYLFIIFIIFCFSIN